MAHAREGIIVRCATRTASIRNPHATRLQLCPTVGRPPDRPRPPGAPARGRAAAWRRRRADAGGRRRAERDVLPSLLDRYPGATAAPRRPIGLRSVPLDRIVGTMRHPSQNTADFLPLPKLRGANWRGRWQRITRAIDRLETLPPVDLVQVGDDYYVVDGHNRVAAARQGGWPRGRRGRHPAPDPGRDPARPGEAGCQLADRYRRGPAGGQGPRGTGRPEARRHRGGLASRAGR